MALYHGDVGIYIYMWAIPWYWTTTTVTSVFSHDSCSIVLYHVIVGTHIHAITEWSYIFIHELYYAMKAWACVFSNNPCQSAALHCHEHTCLLVSSVVVLCSGNIDTCIHNKLCCYCVPQWHGHTWLHMSHAKVSCSLNVSYVFTCDL